MTEGQISEALHMLVRYNIRRGCTSFVQRKLAIKYNEAAEIVDELVQRALITEPDAEGYRHFVCMTQ